MFKKAVALGAMLAGSVAGVSPAVASGNAPSGEAGVQNATGCNWRSGPGQWNQNCIEVQGAGLTVGRVTGSMESWSGYPPLPNSIPAGVRVHVWGTLENGSKYDVSGTAQSGLGKVWVDFNPNTRFQNNSALCSRTQWNGEWSTPACVTIYTWWP